MGSNRSSLTNILNNASRAGRWPTTRGLYFINKEAAAAWKRVVGGTILAPGAENLLFAGLPSTPIGIVRGSGKTIEVSVTCLRDPAITPRALEEKIRNNPSLREDSIIFRSATSSHLAHDPVNTDFHYAFEINRGGGDPDTAFSQIMETRPSLYSLGIATRARKGQMAFLDAVGIKKYNLTPTSPASFLTWGKMAFEPTQRLMKHVQQLALGKEWRPFRVPPESNRLLTAFARTPTLATFVPLMRDRTDINGRTIGRWLSDAVFASEDKGFMAMTFDLTNAAQRQYLAEYQPRGSENPTAARKYSPKPP